MVVMRIKAQDNDLKFTDNWLAVFDIQKGNEDNLFSIETDPKTNEGILKLIKVNALFKKHSAFYIIKLFEGSIHSFVLSYSFFEKKKKEKDLI